jgi:hypothetical protein
VQTSARNVGVAPAPLLLTIDYDDSGRGEQGAQLGWRLDFDRLGHVCGLGEEVLAVAVGRGASLKTEAFMDET